MAVHHGLKPALPLLPLLPGVVIPVIAGKVVLDLHGGGLDLIRAFLRAAVQPSSDPILIEALWRGLQITVFTAVLSWSVSCILGCILGFFSSQKICTLLISSAVPSRWLRWALAPLRSLHELIWGLLLLQMCGLNAWVAVAAIALPYTSLMARVVSDQIDSRDTPALVALQSVGAGSLANLLTALWPAVSTSLGHHMAHRLGCALRSALLLGVFGLGGLGTDLKLSLQSLQFRELWSGLWLLAGVMALLELLVHRGRSKLVLPAMVIAPLIAIPWGRSLDLDLSVPSILLPGNPLLAGTVRESLASALASAPWGDLVLSTLGLTLLASAIAIAGPPLGLLLLPGRLSNLIQRFIWGGLRLFPPPLTALLLLLLAKPSLSLAALALGLHHLGMMGRVLQDDLDCSTDHHHHAVQAMGAGPRMAWLYGKLAMSCRRYLAYSAYRSDVILRDTAVVGLVGGAGLGWQLIESLTSFHWAMVFWLVITYACLTSLGEGLSHWMLERWACKAGQL